MHRDDPETMSRMRAWLGLVADQLGIQQPLLAEAERDILAMVSAVAHGSSRPGAPLTAFLVGVATGRGDDVAALTAKVRELALSQSSEA